MERSTRESRQHGSTAATGADSTSGAVPKPNRKRDGSFQLCCSNGQTISGNCQDPHYRLSRLPISDVWFADCNQDGPPHTLRIYRIGKDETPKDIHLYSYISATRSWNVIEPRPNNDGTNTGNSGDQETGNLGSQLGHFLIKLLSRLVTLLRWLLGDTDEWHTFGKFRPSRDLDLGPSGERQFTDEPFTPLTIRSNGVIFIEGKRYTKRRKIARSINNDAVLFYRKRGNFQKLYIFRKNSKGRFEPTVLNYQYGIWWVWERVGPGSLSDARPLVGARAASILYVLGIIYLLLCLT